MTLVQLRHLISQAQTGLFSQSALVLSLTQPALSRSIRALETELGQALFDRIGRHSEVTPFGREVVERAGQIVHAADDLRESGHQLARGKAGSLRIGLGSGPGAMLMTPLLMHMATHYPQLRLEISRGRIFPNCSHAACANARSTCWWSTPARWRRPPACAPAHPTRCAARSCAGAATRWLENAVA